MSNKAIEELEKVLRDNAKDFLIHDWIDEYILNTNSKFLSLFFFRKCSEQFLAYQDYTHSSIIHGLVKSQMPSSDKMKNLKMLLLRDVNCNIPDGTGKFILDYLIKDNDYKCVEVLLQYGRDLQVSEKCLSKVFQLRNKQEEVFRLIFAYAIKHGVAPHLTGVSDGDTFLHEIMLHEKEKAPFKKWMRYFLTFSEVNISAVNKNGLTVIDLLFCNYEKKRCKCAIKLLINYRFPSYISNDDLCFKLPMLFSLTPNQKDAFNYLCKKAFFSIKNENLLLKNVGTTDDNETNFCHKYLKLKQTASWSSTKSSYMPKKSLQNGLLNLPNHEENEILFEIEISDKVHRKNKTKSSQKSITKNAKAKKYLSSKEAVAYRNLIGGKNSKMLFFCTQITSSGRYLKSEETRDSVSISKSLQQFILLKSSIILCRIKTNSIIDSSKCRKLSQGSYGTVYEQTCVTKAVSSCIAERINRKFLKEINILSLDHHNLVQFLGVHYHKNTLSLVMKEMLSKWLCINPSSTLHSLHNGLLYLHSRNVIHCNFLLCKSDKIKNNFDKINKIQLPGHIFPEVCASNLVYTRKLNIYSFRCAHEGPIVDTTFKLAPILLQYYASEASSKMNERLFIHHALYNKKSEDKEVYFSYLFGGNHINLVMGLNRRYSILLFDKLSADAESVNGMKYFQLLNIDDTDLMTNIGLSFLKSLQVKVYHSYINEIFVLCIIIKMAYKTTEHHEMKKGLLKLQEIILLVMVDHFIYDNDFKNHACGNTEDLNKIHVNKSKKSHIILSIIAHIIAMSQSKKFIIAVITTNMNSVIGNSKLTEDFKRINAQKNVSVSQEILQSTTLGIRKLFDYVDTTTVKDDIHENTVEVVTTKSKSSKFTYGLWELMNDMDSTFHKTIIMPFLLQNYISLNTSSGCIVVLQGVMCLLPYHKLLDGQNGDFFTDKQLNKKFLPQLTYVHQKITKKIETKESTQQETFPLLVKLYKITLPQLQNDYVFLKDIYQKDAELVATKCKSLSANLKCVLKTQVSIEIGSDPEELFFALVHEIILWHDVINTDDYFKHVKYISIVKDVVYLVLAPLIGYKCELDKNRSKLHIKKLSISSKDSNKCSPVVSRLNFKNIYLKSLLDAEREAGLMGNGLRTIYALRESPVTKKSIHHARSTKPPLHLTEHGLSLVFTHLPKNDIGKWKYMALASGCSLHKNQNFCNVASLHEGIQNAMESDLSEDFDLGIYQFLKIVQFSKENLSGKVPVFCRLPFDYVLQFEKLPSLQNEALVQNKALVSIDITDELKYGVLYISTNLEIKNDFEMADKLSSNTLHGNFSHIPSVYSTKLDSLSFGWILLQIIKPKVFAINITPFCSENVDPFKIITPHKSVNRVDGYESCILCLEEISFTKFELLYDSTAQSCHFQLVKEYDSFLNVLHFLALMHYLKFVPAFNWQMCESAYQLSYKNICDSQKKMIFYFYTIYRHLCKRVLLRRKWVFLELPPIPLVIILTNKSLLHESKLVNLLQHDLSSIYLFSIDLVAKALLKNVHNKVLNYTPLHLWTVIYDFCKKQKIKNIERKCVSKHKIYFGCSCYEVEKIPTLCFDDISNNDINNDSIRNTLLQSTSLQHLHLKTQALDIPMLLNHENDETSCEMMDEIAIFLNQTVVEKVMKKTAQIWNTFGIFTNVSTTNKAKNSTSNVVCALKGKAAYATLAKSFTKFDFKMDCTITDELQKPHLNEKNLTSVFHSNKNLLLQELHHVDCRCMQQNQKVLQTSKVLFLKSTETENEDKTNPATTDGHLFYQPTNSRYDINVKVHSTGDKTSIPYQVVNDDSSLYVTTTHRNHLQVFEESNSEASVDTCVNDLTESLSFRVNSCFDESESCDSLHRCTSSSNTLFLSNNLVECISTNGQESFQHVGEPSESPTLNMIGQRIYSPLHVFPTIPCINISAIVTAIQDHGILSEKESRTRGFNNGHDEDSFVESESCDLLYRLASSTTPFLSNSFSESSTNGQESFQHVGEPSTSFSLNVIGQRMYSPFHAVPTIPCSNLTINETVLQDGVLTKTQKDRIRGFDDGSSDSSSDEDNDEDKRGIHTSLVSHYHSHNPQQHSSPRYHSLSAAVNTNITPQTAAGTGLVGSKHAGKLREVATTKPFIGMGVTLPKSPAMYTSKGEYLISDSLNERGPILLDIPNGRNELVMAAYSTQSIPKLYPIIGLRKELPGIALPPPIPLDLPKLHPSKKVASIASHQQVVTEQPVKSGFDVRTVPETVPVQQPQYMTSVASHQQQQAPLSQSMDFSDPVIIIDRAALFLTAGDYGATIKVLEILDKHLVLPEDIDMAKEFGQGLANYKNLHYKAAKSCFTALFEKSNNYRSLGNQALASIYLGEIEMSWAKYKDAEKHFTLAVTNYSPDNVAEKYQQTILTKSAVLVKKGQCHRSLSQIKEAINAFKVAKEVAESAQQQARGSKLKTAKEDELSAVCALGNILQSLGDYDQSFDHYEKSLKLAGELGDQVSIGWAHGNLGNAMLGLDQKDKALDHLITAFHMSARYEGNPLAVGRAVSNLGNAYQAIGNLKKAKEHYEIALGHAIYGNDLQGQGRACGNIGNIYMLLKEPVQAVHYYTETLRLSIDRNTKITGHHNRGCARFDVAECIIQGKKPKELVPATTTQDSEYGRLTIKLTDEVITTDPVQETKPNRDPSAQSISEQKESSMSVEMLPVVIKGKVYEEATNVEIVRTAEALPFLETAQRDLLEAIESHEQGVQNVKGSHEALSLSLSLFESNSRSFYKMQETLIELGKLCQRLARLGLIDMTATEPQEFKDALVYGEQARARTLGELILQKKKTMYSDLFSISTPLAIQDIYKAVKLQKYPVIFLSYCVSKLLMWILVPVKDEVIMRCQSVELKEEDLENSSFELYIRYNLLQFLSKDEIHIFRSCAYEQESPFTVLHDVIGIKIIEGLKSVGCSEVTEFIVIPDSVTHLLPFSPLMNKHNWQFFGDKYRVRIVPSFLSLLVMSVTSNPVVEIPGDKSDFLIVGNPTIPQFMYDSTPWNLGRLPYAEKEAISVASVLGTIPVLREQATKQSVLYRLRSAKVIHLATHGSASAGFLAFTSSFPVSKSGLAEKEHILIFPKEIETLNISPALVVLSSCDSARGPVKAEGVIGMARAFLSAGAHSVLVSLWRVPDESANVFMNFFYQFLVNGLPSLEALQRSMQCLRCFLKYSHYVHWSGFQIIGKEVTFHKDSNAQFPIQNMLGEVSIFPRQHVKNIEENLLGVRNKIFTDVQILVGTPGNEPEECARDFIKNCYYYYPCGVYWYDASNELLLETTMKVAHQIPLMGGGYKEQKELDPLPTISNPSLLSTKSSKPMSRKEKKLIVLHNFTSLESCACIMREMRDASTDIIIVSNELFCKEEIAKEFDKNFNRGCNIIEVTNLQHISIMQRIVYGLLEKNSFVARDADHIAFTLLSEYSRGAATIVHLLTSLMQKSDDNSRTGFELAKQQLKLHIAHRTLEKDLDKYSMQNTLSEKVQERGGVVMTEMESQIDRASADLDYSSFSAPRGLEHPNETFDVKPTYANDNKKQSNISDATSGFVSMGSKTDEGFKSPITIVPEGYSYKKQSNISDATSGFVSMDSKTDEVSKSPITIVPEGYSYKKQSNISDATSGFVSMDSKTDEVSKSPITIVPEGYSYKKQSNISDATSGKNDNSESPIALMPESYTLREGYKSPDHKTASTSSEGSSIYTEVKSSEVQESVTSTSQPTGVKQSIASSIIKTITSMVAGSDDNRQTFSSDTTQLPATAKPGKESVNSVKKHPLYLYISDLLSTTHNISLPAHHLLNSLVITGPIPLPLFYVEELDNVVLNAVYNKEKERIQAESSMKQLIKGGVIRKSCYPILYHKDLNKDYIDLSIQPMFVPKLICDAVKNEMDDTDTALSVLSVQRALENLLRNESKPDPIHLQYLLILCNQLHDVCSEELHEFGDQLLIANQKLKLRVALMTSKPK